MALIVEDGSNVPDADTYVTLIEYRAYLDAIGKEDLNFASKDEQNIRRAFSDLNRKNYKGTRQYRDQVGAWPRVNVGVVDGWEVLPNSIPQAIKDAQCEYAHLIQLGIDPTAPVSGGSVSGQKSKAGPVETETQYFEAFITPRLISVSTLLGPYLSSGNYQVRMGRG